MTIADDGNVLTIDSKPWLIGKIFGITFGVLAVTFPLILVLSLVMKPRQGSIECDRARGTCRLQRSAWSKEMALADIAAAKLEYQRGSRNSSSSHYLALQLKNGPNLSLSENVYHKELRDALSAVVVGFNRFLLEEQPAYHASFVASDTDWAALIPMTLIMPLAFWIFLRFWVVRKIEIDRAARTLRFRMQRKFHPPSDEVFAFSDITGLSADGYNYARIVMATSRGVRLLLFMPYTPELKAQLVTLTQKLPEILGIDMPVGAELRKRWRL